MSRLDPYDAVVVGAGVVGCSAAFHLARLGVTRVAIVEREPLPGSGSTSKANGGIRAQFTTRPNIAMSLLSMAILDELAEDIGQPPLYRKAGYLFLTCRPERLRAMTEAAEFQRSCGVAVEILDAAAARRAAPYVAGDDLVGGTFGERDGFLDPGGIANYFLRRAVRAGVQLRCGAAVERIEPAAGGGLAVHTSTGSVRAPAVVLAAGPWTGVVAALAGARIPVEPVRRHILVTGPCRTLPAVIPMTIDADTGVLIRREGDRVVVAWSNADEPPGFHTEFDEDFPPRVAEPLERRFPQVADAGIDLRRSWAGFYEVTPDHHAVLGAIDDVPGLFVAGGFSGHGVMHAPAAGACVAQLIAEGRCTRADIAPLSPSRFERGATIHETMVL